MPNVHGDDQAIRAGSYILLVRVLALMAAPQEYAEGSLYGVLWQSCFMLHAYRASIPPRVIRAKVAKHG